MKIASYLIGLTFLSIGLGIGVAPAGGMCTFGIGLILLAMLGYLHGSAEEYEQAVRDRLG